VVWAGSGVGYVDVGLGLRSVDDCYA
jgi:hypothetical protein